MNADVKSATFSLVETVVMSLLTEPLPLRGEATPSPREGEETLRLSEDKGMPKEGATRLGLFSPEVDCVGGGVSGRDRSTVEAVEILSLSLGIGSELAPQIALNLNFLDFWNPANSFRKAKALTLKTAGARVSREARKTLQLSQS